MKSGKTDLEIRPNTLKENKRVLYELRRRNKIDRRSLHEINKLVAKFNAKNVLGLSKNAKASCGQKQEKNVEDVYGPIEGFPPGSWWGIRMDCSRDGVHQPFNRDVQEGLFGAVSLCTSHPNADNDVDLGDYLTYTGDEYRPEVRDVHLLLKNFQNGLPLRLIRSYNLSNDYAPKTGYRYDGLYTVIGCWLGVASEAVKYYKFALARLSYQAPATWQLSRKSTSHHRVRDNQQNNHNEEDTVRNVRPRSLMTKCPLQKLNSTSQESTIVTRCISKKSDGQSSAAASHVDVLVSNGNRLLENHSSPLCKFQNTNISIRTDLYDSSNIVPQEPRKTLPMTFCRTYKSSRTPGRATHHSNVVSLNLNSCGPCPRDNAQESLIQSRSGIAKLSIGQSPSLDHANESIVPKSSAIVECEMIPDKKRSNSPTVDEARVETETANASSSAGSQEISTESKPIEGETSAERGSKVSLNAASPVAEKLEQDEMELSRSHGTESPVTVRNSEEKPEPKETPTKESHVDLESLTPDQMLNFIVKQKCHPRAKLLIGSVIGLATGESTILRAYESLISRKNLWSRDNDATRVERNELRMRENVDNALSRDYESGKSTASKDTNERTVSRSLRTRRENKDRLLRKRTLRRTRVSKRLTMCSEKKPSANLRQGSASQRLRNANLTDAKKLQQPFSKSTVAKKSVKCAKKRRGELANLVIDAKIGPLIRGPRNRRLRCKSHIFAKKVHTGSDLETNCCIKKTNGLTGNGSKKEIGELSSRRTKVSRLKSSSISRYGATSKRGHENDNSVERRASRCLDVDVTERETAETRSHGAAEKRKLSDDRASDKTRKVSRRDTRECDEIRRVKMVDSGTQCSTSRRDATTSIDRDMIEKPMNSIKIEYIDVDDVKSDVSTDEPDLSIRGDRQCLRDVRRVSAFPEAMSTWLNESSSRELSAFVPVNTSDRDFRIARLRSIGFKPIQPDRFFDYESCPFVLDGENEDVSTNASSAKSSETNAVTNRGVDELFNKYTSEETTTVGYMDHDLHYEDIENEETNRSRARKSINNCNSARRDRRVQNMQRNTGEKSSETANDFIALSNEEDSEVPWHGWKKFVKNKQAQWIGW